MRSALTANSDHSRAKPSDLQRDVSLMNRLVEEWNMSTPQPLGSVLLQVRDPETRPGKKLGTTAQSEREGRGG
jgi:hypothetical protein